ncbi:MAG: hypothetical protein U1F43_25620, partial [Myxococcota bacterium]
ACQERCGGTCDGCKAACAPGDAACVRGCAEARASCRDSCDEASTHCRYTECGAAATACWEPIDRTSQECDKDACNGWSKCRKSGSEAKCQTKFPELSDFCRQSCRAEGWGLIDRLDAAQQKLDEETYQAQVDDGLVDYLGEPDDELAGHCTPAAHCPADYAIASRFLGLFCDNSLSDAGLRLLQKAVAEKKVGKAGLEVIFNAYGAFYGYTFTQKTWLNDFFYAHGAWLPANCEGNMKRFASEREMGGMYMRARDRVKRIWNTLH